MNADSHSSLHTTAIIFFFQQHSAAFLLYKFPTNSHQLCPLQGSHPSSRHSTSSALSLEDVQQWKVERESCACTGDLSSQLEYLFVNECPPSSWLPCRGVFLFFPRGSCYLPNFPAGLLHCTKGRTCLSLYSESTAQQGIRAHNPAGIAALARTTGPCSLILFLVLSAGMWFVREKASAWLIEQALSKAFTQSLPHPSTPAQPWCWGSGSLWDWEPQDSLGLGGQS